jgi:hypothetical protein
MRLYEYNPTCHSEYVDKGKGKYLLLGTGIEEGSLEAWEQIQQRAEDLLKERTQGMVDTTPSALNQSFPFTLEDLTYWVVKKKDGSIIKYSVVGEHTPSAWKSATTHTLLGSSTYSLSDWCKHDPIGEPIFRNKKVGLWIADASGMRAYKDKFDLTLDCGQIFSQSMIDAMNPLGGNANELIKELSKHHIASGGDGSNRILKIDWFDRQAPPLHPQFFIDLANRIKGKVCTACQGGHGRSGTSLVCLMMALTPDYTPYDAICHLRALHCPRAIESTVQHQYIDWMAKVLGREENGVEVKEVKSFKDAFLAIDKASAKPFQDQLRKKVESGKVTES